jgi:hypothetical protein
MLSRLQTKIIADAFGEDLGGSAPLEPGQYNVGDYYQINIVTNGAITVSITDLLTGQTTTVSVPYF